MRDLASYGSIRRSVSLSVVCLLLSASTLASQQRVFASPALSLYANLKTCAAGYYMNSGGGCSIAPAGTYSAGGAATSATPCAAGLYQPETGQSSCVLAPAGSYVSAAGAMSATLCPAGQYQSNTGGTSCDMAPVGSYATGPGATSALPCAAGFTTTAAGSSGCVAISPLVGYDALIGAAQTTPGVAAAEAAKLVNGRKDLAAGKNSQACKAVDAFVSYVNKESGKKISAANATMLLSKSQDAKNAMGC